MRLRRSKMDATAASIDEPAITGVSVAGANGDVAIFIERSEQVPERLLKRGRRIVIMGAGGVISDALYGRIASGMIDRMGSALVVEMGLDGDPQRITRLAVEG